MNFEVDIHSKRYLQAKYYKALANDKQRLLITLIGYVSFIAGVIFLILDFWFAWLLFIPTTLAVMLNEWYKHSLSQINPINDSEKPEHILNPETLASIGNNNLSPNELIDCLKQTSGLWFLANRFSLHPEIIKTMQISQDWWLKAIELYKKYPNPKGLDASHIITAVVLTSPDINTVLSHTKNKLEDIYDALNWISYVNELLDNLHKRHDNGGLARDWANGYTPLLDNYATNISRSIQYGKISHREIVGHSNVINQMTNIFTSNGRANIALVGESGSGRSTCIQAFAEELLFNVNKGQVKYNQIYQIDMSSILTKVKPNQVTNLMQSLALEAYKAKNIVMYLDNAGAFFGSDGGLDITDLILPIIKAGRVRMIFSFTPLHWQYLQAKKPQVVASLNYQVVQPTNAHDTLRILENQCLFLESQYKCIFSYESLKEIYRLADRYGPEIAMPGRAISVMEDVARNNQNGLVLKVNVQKTLEQTTGIKISSADTEEKNILLDLESKIRQRVIGQDDAVREIVGALKRSRAGVSNPNRPIGTFLFLGPTGVGKTEMSKTLANVYFGGEAGMVRVDMNEFITQDSVNKLLTGTSDYGSSFLETIRRKPFSVVLFDEIEKAHPDVVNALLQMLDEGVMRDNDNRVVSFKDAIIIATSNAGADIIRQQISAGVQIKDFEKHLADDLIDKGIFKPEFINRFDGVIIFSPLNQEQLAQVVKVMLSDINNKLQEQGVMVNLTQDAVDLIIAQGYDQRLGARPLRRMMQRTVESAVSDILLSGNIEHGSTINLNAEAIAKYLT
jgi:ATP-dependent Clp protease ATP-binding subunit ClpA